MVERVKARTRARGQGSEAGPEAEQAWWGARLARLASVAEQARSPPCRAVLAVGAAARCRPLKRWRELEARARPASPPQAWLRRGGPCISA